MATCVLCGGMPRHGDWLKVWLKIAGLSWLMLRLEANSKAEAVVLILYTLGWMVTWLRALHWLQRQHMRISSIPQ